MRDRFSLFGAWVVGTVAILTAPGGLSTGEYLLAAIVVSIPSGFAWKLGQRAARRWLDRKRGESA